MQRILETEVMEGAEEARVYDTMDHSAANDSFVSDLLSLGATDGEWLDLGTGTALIPLELCRQEGFAARIVAVDLSESMLALARCHIEAAGLTKRIRLDLADAKALNWPASTFDAVISNSIIHHVPDPEPVLREAVRVARPGARLFFRDLMRPESMEYVNRLVAIYGVGESEYAQRLFRESLQAALNLEEIRAIIERIGFSPDSVYASSDRHWTWNAIR